MAKRAREEAAAQQALALNQEDQDGEYEYYDEEDDDGHTDLAP